MQPQLIPPLFQEALLAVWAVMLLFTVSQYEGFSLGTGQGCGSATPHVGGNGVIWHSDDEYATECKLLQCVTELYFDVKLGKRTVSLQRAKMYLHFIVDQVHPSLILHPPCHLEC